MYQLSEKKSLNTMLTNDSFFVWFKCCNNNDNNLAKPSLNIYQKFFFIH